MGPTADVKLPKPYPPADWLNLFHACAAATPASLVPTLRPPPRRPPHAAPSPRRPHPWRVAAGNGLHAVMPRSPRTHAHGRTGLLATSAAAAPMGFPMAVSS